MVRELSLRNVATVSQRLIQIEYKGLVFDEPLRFDVLVEDCLLLELKSVQEVIPIHKAKLFSYVIHHRPAPGFTPPYAIAVVELAEGPRMMTNIVGCPQTPDALVLDMPLEVTFEKQTDQITLPFFKPAAAK